MEHPDRQLLSQILSRNVGTVKFLGSGSSFLTVVGSDLIVGEFEQVEVILV